MNGLRKTIKLLILLLLIDAAWVFLGLFLGWVMWPWICAYWALLTLKNLADYLYFNKTTANNRKENENE